jgi:hypothetical protein
MNRKQALRMAQTANVGTGLHQVRLVAVFAGSDGEL